MKCPFLSKISLLTQTFPTLKIISQINAGTQVDIPHWVHGWGTELAYVYTLLCMICHWHHPRYSILITILRTSNSLSNSVRNCTYSSPASKSSNTMRSEISHQSAFRIIFQEFSKCRCLVDGSKLHCKDFFFLGMFIKSQMPLMMISRVVICKTNLICQNNNRWSQSMVQWPFLVLQRWWGVVARSPANGRK